jgi:hypothetical protein
MQRGLKWLTVGLVAGGLLLASGWGVSRVAAQAPDAEIQAEIQAKIAEIQAGIDTHYETVVDHSFNDS